jgi:hypothetical protein
VAQGHSPGSQMAHSAGSADSQRCYFDLLLGLERVCFCALDSLIPRTSAQGSLVAFFWSGTFFIVDL